jgi:hypothetical protein
VTTAGDRLGPQQRPVWVTFATLVAVVAACTAFPASAFACSYSSHCYGEVEWFPPQTYTGGLVWVKATRLYVTNNADWVNHEMWVVTRSDPYANEWVEAGLMHGTVAGGYHNRSSFWAEVNSAGTYTEHYVQNISLDTVYYDKISYSGNGSWGIYLNGNQVGGSSYQHGSVTSHLNTGGEVVTNTALLSGQSTNMQKRGSDGQTWTYDWGGSIFQTGGVNAGWTAPAKSMWDSFN